MRDWRQGPWEIERVWHPFEMGDNDVPVVALTVPCAETSDGIWTEAIEVRGPDAEEMALLITAAPDLLEALQNLKPILDRAESNASGNMEWDDVSARINAARAAIARAKGETE